jgi:glycerol dehydrogenase
MKQTAVFPGRCLQAGGAIASLAEEIQRLGAKALVVAGGAAERVIVPRHLAAWRERIAVTVERFAGECSDEEIERLGLAAFPGDPYRTVLRKYGHNSRS